MIIQCPSCSTNFFLDEKKFNGLPKKLKCSRCSLIWTSSSKGEPIDVPKLFEPSSTQGLTTNEKSKERVDKNKKPDHPLPVVFNKQQTKKTDFIFWIFLLLLFTSFIISWNKRVLIVNKFPNLSSVIEIFDPSIKFRGIEINNLSSRISSNENGFPLIVSGSLINQEKYIRKVPSIMIIIESNDRRVLMKETIKFSNEFFDYMEIKDFEVKFNNFPEDASNIFVEIIE
tara:strand:+ start:329 stop:1012 length:684 start_codon:yes stop_codon:yes gene_type:complete